MTDSLWWDNFELVFNEARRSNLIYSMVFLADGWGIKNLINSLVLIVFLEEERLAISMEGNKFGKELSFRETTLIYFFSLLSSFLSPFPQLYSGTEHPHSSSIIAIIDGCR